jgi:hypothetical protein
VIQTQPKVIRNAYTLREIFDCSCVSQRKQVRNEWQVGQALAQLAFEGMGAWPQEIEKRKCVGVTTDRWPMAGGRQEHVEHHGLSTNVLLYSANAEIAATVVRVTSRANITAVHKMHLYLLSLHYWSSVEVLIRNISTSRCNQTPKRK